MKRSALGRPSRPPLSFSLDEPAGSRFERPATRNIPTSLAWVGHAGRRRRPSSPAFGLGPPAGLGAPGRCWRSAGLKPRRPRVRRDHPGLAGARRSGSSSALLVIGPQLVVRAPPARTAPGARLIRTAPRHRLGQGSRRRRRPFRTGTDTAQVQSRLPDDWIAIGPGREDRADRVVFPGVRGVPRPSARLEVRGRVARRVPDRGTAGRRKVLAVAAAGPAGRAVALGRPWVERALGTAKPPPTAKPPGAQADRRGCGGGCRG